MAGAVTVVDEVHGFRFFEQRDLLGFVDGTENPDGPEAVEAVADRRRGPAISPARSYVHVQKYTHDMTAWNALSVTEQERVIGRTKLEDIEFDDAVKPPNSHVALNVITDDDGNELQIVRANMPFGDAGRRASPAPTTSRTRADPDVTERMLRNMFIGDPPGNTDRILDFSTAVTGGLFFAPTADFLDDPPAAARTPTRRPATAPSPPPRPVRRLTGHRQPERTTPMNNLYRDLAPITEVAWAEIELEAARTFKRHIAGRRVVDVSEPGGPVTAAVSTGHLLDVASPGDGVIAHLRDARPLVRLRVPFTVNRVDIDDVERGSQDSDWDPVKEAAKKLAFVEDRAIFEGYAAASIERHPQVPAPTRRWRCPKTPARSPT